MKQPELTKRELFAAMAMQGIASIPGGCQPNMDVHLAIRYADALIKALEEDERKGEA